MSQQGTEQNASAVRGRLHVDTLHAQYELANGSSFLQLEQRFQNDRSAIIPTLASVWKREVGHQRGGGAPACQRSRGRLRRMSCFTREGQHKGRFALCA